jgi:hypothetical protein
MFRFHQLEHLSGQGDQHRYQNELKQYLLLDLNFFQYHELISEEPEREIEKIFIEKKEKNHLTSLLFSRILSFNLSFMITITWSYSQILSRKYLFSFIFRIKYVQKRFNVGFFFFLFKILRFH